MAGVTGTVTGQAALSGNAAPDEPEHWESRMSRPVRARRAVARCRPHGRASGGAAARRERGDRGSITLMLVALAGIVIDGGAKLRAAETADAAAQEAARAGAGMVNQSTAYSTGSFVVDPARAVAAAKAYLAAGHFVGTVSRQGQQAIRVRVTVVQPTSVLSIIGITSMTSVGTATATLVTGVTGPGA